MLFAVGAGVVLAGCHRDLHELEHRMTGSFSSAAQHAADPENYFDIRLRMAPIWQQRGDGAQVWGATAEGYVFLKLDDHPER